MGCLTLVHFGSHVDYLVYHSCLPEQGQFPLSYDVVSPFLTWEKEQTCRHAASLPEGLILEIRRVLSPTAGLV